MSGQKGAGILLGGKTMADKVQYYHELSFDPPGEVETNHTFEFVAVVVLFLVIVVFPLYFWFNRQRHTNPQHTRLDSVDIEMQSAELVGAASPALRDRITSFRFECSSALSYEEQMCVLCQTEFLHGTHLASLPPCDHTFHSCVESL